MESTNPAFNKAIVRVNIFKQHRQTIQVVIITVEFPVIVINILVYAILDVMVSLNSFWFLISAAVITFGIGFVSFPSVALCVCGNWQCIY